MKLTETIATGDRKAINEAIANASLRELREAHANLLISPKPDQVTITALETAMKQRQTRIQE
jgi:hypothetical protein